MLKTAILSLAFMAVVSCLSGNPNSGVPRVSDFNEAEYRKIEAEMTMQISNEMETIQASINESEDEPGICKQLKTYYKNMALISASSSGSTAVSPGKERRTCDKGGMVLIESSSRFGVYKKTYSACMSGNGTAIYSGTDEGKCKVKDGKDGCRIAVSEFYFDKFGLCSEMSGSTAWMLDLDDEHKCSGYITAKCGGAEEFCTFEYDEETGKCEVQ